MARFDPSPNARVLLDIHDQPTVFMTSEHPSAPGFVHSMEGAKGKVYSLRQAAERYALKVMKPKHKIADLADTCEALARFTRLPGMRVCNRYCLTSHTSPRAVSQYPQLEFAILMPWIEGSSWFDIVAARKKQPLELGRSRALGAAFAAIVAGLEAIGVAHCDLSAANIIIAANQDSRGVELIDVEDIFAPGFQAPSFVPAGTPGYQHRVSSQGQWGPAADRFAAAVLLAEMLGWASAHVVRAAYGESFFDPAEMQSPVSARYKTLHGYLLKELPGAAALFEQAWRSSTLEECPALSKWREVLGGDGASPEKLPSQEWVSLPAPKEAAGVNVQWVATSLKEAARPVRPLQVEWRGLAPPGAAAPLQPEASAPRQPPPGPSAWVWEQLPPPPKGGS